MNEKLILWNNFCEKYINFNVGVPLFSTRDDRIVDIKQYGKNNRLILRRSEEMENFIINEVTHVLEDYKNKNDVYEGLIYMMYKIKNNLIVPLYIGKSEKYGKNDNNLSRNISNIKSNKYFFCRWGDNYAYHIGDLSAVVCPGHPKEKMNRKYQIWASRLFENYPTTEPKLKEDIYFWISAWQKGNTGIFTEFGGTPLTALEYQLISVAANLFPEELLNQEGVNRGQKVIWILLLDIYSKILLENLHNIG
ncbi:hypothetical protein [Planktothrix sp.]|uniref:hypothetical protein n=1 Tax=Planktothrix sp. TaxID=3088171 RepID=UPI0038D43343